MVYFVVTAEVECENFCCVLVVVFTRMMCQDFVVCLEDAIKHGLSGARYSTVQMSEGKLVKRLVLKHFQGAINLLMHILGLTDGAPVELSILHSLQMIEQ